MSKTVDDGGAAMSDTSNPILEGMARAYLSHFGTFEPQAADKLAIGFALLWLADNVSDEMADAFMQAWSRPWATHTEEELKHKPVVRALAAALRQAAGGGE